MKTIIITICAVLGIGIGYLTIPGVGPDVLELKDTTPDWSAPDAVVTERDKQFNQCVSRVWDGLDWEGSYKSRSWGTAIGMFCIDSLNKGLED